MSIAKGYKQTEVGVIPEDWEVVVMSDYLKSKPDYGIGAAAVKYNDNLFTYLRITDISYDGKFDKTSIASVANINAEKYILKSDEIVVARTGASVGKTYLYDGKDGKLVFAGFLIRLKPDLNKISSAYLFAFTQTNYYKSWIINNSMRSGQPGINSNQLNNILFSLPPLPEQTAIANALSDMDALIAQTEKLIEKKKAIKQGVMQELLKPKEGWVTKKLGEVCENIVSGKSKTQSQEGIFPIFGSTGIIGWSNSCDYFGHKILVARVGANAGTVNVVDGKYCVTDNTLMVSLKTETDLNFIYRFLVLFQLNKLAFGSGQPLITGGQLKTIEIPIPKAKEEQTAIANALSDIDAELERTETKLQKLKNQKQGMMQALLTGKIRLV